MYHVIYLHYLQCYLWLYLLGNLVLSYHTSSHVITYKLKKKKLNVLFLVLCCLEIIDNYSYKPLTIEPRNYGTYLLTKI